MVILKFQPADDDAGDASFEVSGENFGMACGELLQELSRRYYTDPDEFTDELFAEVFEVLQDLAPEDECIAERTDFSTPEQDYTIIRRRPVKAEASPVANVKANVNPFIAAPDLLEALKFLVDDYDADDRNDDRTERCVANARAAIAKAEGK